MKKLEQADFQDMAKYNVPGKNNIIFLANEEFIKSALERGLSLSQIYNYLHIKGVFTASYQTFRRLAKKHICKFNAENTSVAVINQSLSENTISNTTHINQNRVNYDPRKAYVPGFCD